MSPRGLGAIARVAAVLAAAAAPAAAFEAAPTHAALTESAAWPSPLGEALRRAGWSRGLLEALPARLDAAPRVAAARLRARLASLDPGAGYAPGPTGAQPAIGWLVAGAVIEQAPAARERHHFLDPRTGGGLDQARPGLSFLMSALGAADAGGTFAGLFTGTNFDLTGIAADRWALSADNEQSYRAFLDGMRRAAAAAEPAERADALARALLALGGVLHLLQDMASPSHVRNDFVGGHLARMGDPLLDRGSPFERFVARAWGQAAPPPGPPGPARVRLRDFFHAADGTGLADFTARQLFSPGTLPRPVAARAGAPARETLARINATLARPEPRIASLAVSDSGRTGYARGLVPHLARWRRDAAGRIAWDLDAACHADYGALALREAARASRDLIAFALRGRLDVARDGARLAVANAGPALAEGRLRLLAEDAGGRRWPLAELPARLPSPRGAELAAIDLAPPADARRLVVLLDGADGWGEPLVATEVVPLD